MSHPRLDGITLGERKIKIYQSSNAARTSDQCFVTHSRFGFVKLHLSLDFLAAYQVCLCLVSLMRGICVFFVQV